MVLLFHAPDGGDDTGERDARAGLESLEIVGHMGAGVPPGFRAVAGVVFDPRPDSMDRWRTLRKAWERPHPPGPFIASGELFWAPGGSAFIDRFLPGAKAAIVIVNPDRTLRGAVSLDGRAQRPEGLDKELRALLEAAPAPSNPPNKDAAPEAPR
jgi:hypothetical protein